MQELATIALFDPAELFDADGKLIPIKDLPEQTRRDGLAVRRNWYVGKTEVAKNQP